MATLIPPNNIPATDCIGNSLTTINGNFNILFEDIQNVQTSLSFPASLKPNGYQKLPSGLIMQWGTGNIPGPTGLAVTFPIPFPNACLNVSVTKHAPNGGTTLTDQNQPVVVGAPSLTKVNFDNSIGTSTTPIYWFAIGY